MDMVAPLAAAAAFLSLAMMAAWAIQRKTGNSGWIDTVWSLAVGTAGIGLALAATGGEVARQVIVALIIGVWALRLGGYIAFRSAGAGEDPRYAWLINEWGPDAGRQLFIFLQAQAAAGFVLVLAVYLAAINPAPGLGVQDGLALLIFVVALAGAALSDEQLRRFKADPANRGKVCDVGLWSWSRHPNYFFEWLGWVAFPLLAISFANPWGVLALGAPALMYLLLVHVSGIPPLEAHMERSRGAAFAAYRARVNAFFPGPPRAQERGAIPGDHR